jgi:hypothetical protein
VVGFCENGYISESSLQIQRNSIKIPMTFFTEIEKNPKIKWKHKRSQITKAVLSNNSSIKYLTSNSTTDIVTKTA